MSEKIVRGFPREEAIEFCTEAINSIYEHRPTRFSLTLTASIDEIPMYHIEYDGHARVCVYRNEED